LYFFIQAVNRSLGGEKNCVVYTLFCIFIIVIVIIITIINIIISSSISFVVLLNCLYLNPKVFPFVHFSSPSCCEGGEGMSERQSSA